MSIEVARVIEFPNDRRAQEARPVSKLRVLELVRRLILEDEEERQRWKESDAVHQEPCPATLTSAALSVVQYLAEVTDKKTGIAVVEKQTIAERIGRSQATVKRQLKRLVELGVIDREARRKGARYFANAYRLIDPGSPVTQPKLTNDPTWGHQRPPYARGFLHPSPKVLDPGGLTHGRKIAHENVTGLCAASAVDNSSSSASFAATGPPFSTQHRTQDADFESPAGGQSQEFDWIGCGEWLAREARFADYAQGRGAAYQLAANYLVSWRARWGDQVVIETMMWARSQRGGRGLFGEFLIEMLVKRLGKP